MSTVRPSSNVSFKPIPSTSGRCAKLRLNVILDPILFVAGEAISGRLELISATKNDLWLGEIAVELSGSEAIDDKNHRRSKSFLTSRTVFQGERCRPSDAVRGPVKNGYFQATKGKTVLEIFNQQVFRFKFPVPVDAPASYNFQSIAQLRYTVTALVQFKIGGQTDVLFRTKDVSLIDRWDRELEAERARTVSAVNFRKPFMGGDGAVELEATLDGTFFTAGSTLPLDIKVSNRSRKKVVGVKVFFIKRLLTVHPNGHQGEGDGTKTFNHKYPAFRFNDSYDASETRTSLIHIAVPADAQTIRNTLLGEIVWRVVVSLHMPGILA